ncbi:MAG: hypothetical protein JXA21_06470, partial [Anaerolineae bacterium]|nr:hypothetical protein [Anaerolineae bacterium]
MRVFVLPAITLSEDKARYDSGFLLASKLGRLAGRLQDLHVYLLSPYPIKSWMEENPWFTVLELPPHTPFRNYPH